MKTKYKISKKIDGPNNDSNDFKKDLNFFGKKTERFKLRVDFEQFSFLFKSILGALILKLIACMFFFTKAGT